VAHQWRGVIREYADRLPVTEETTVITLGEGGTPLVHAQQLSALTGCEVYLKVEGMNPTGSFKDRGMTMAMTAAVAAGAKAVVCASTGNTSASAAAYATAAGLKCVVLVPEGYHPVAAAPGYHCYYLNILAGSAQSLANFDDPALAWVKAAWPPLDPRLPLVTPALEA